MQLTIDSAEPLEDVLKVIGSLYDVRLAVVPAAAVDAPAPPLATKAVAATHKRSGAARSSSVDAAGRRRSGGSAQVDPAAVRHWARENGHPVRDRGRVADAVVAAYRESLGDPG